MRWNTFAGSLVFAAAAAAGLVPVVLGLTPWLGARTGLGLYLVAVTALYLRELRPAGQRRHLAVVATCVIGLLAVGWLRSATGIALVLAVVLGIVRSGVAFRGGRGRVLLVDAVLIGGGVLFAGAVGGTTLGGWVLALWGFLLVQSVYVLIAGMPARRATEAGEDAFAAAYGRAVTLLEERDV